MYKKKEEMAQICQKFRNYRLQNEMSTARAVAFLRPSRYIWGNGTD
jgi:hypothetical protein